MCSVIFHRKALNIKLLSIFFCTNNADGKRNIQAMKNSLKGRKKREIGGGGETEVNEPVFQNGPLDYEELLQALNEDGPYAEKRFLGE
jgi:hypothetical protein